MLTGGDDTLLAMLARIRDAVVLVEVDRDWDRKRGRGGARVVYANHAFVELSGYTAEAMIGHSPALLQAAETDLAELERLCAAAEQGHRAQAVVLARRADATRLWVELDTAPLDDTAAAIRIMGVARDVTERVRSERLQGVAPWRAHDLMVVTDAEGRLQRFEPPQDPVLGHDPGDLRGRTAFELLHASDADALRGALAEPSSPGSLAVRLRHADGSWRWLELDVGDHRSDPRVAGLVLTGRDVSAREQARTEMARTADQLRMALDFAGLGTWQLDLREDTVSPGSFSSERVAIDPDGPPMSLANGLARVHPADREILREAIRRAVAERGELERAFRVVRPDGSWRWLVACAAVACAPDGTPTHVNGITLDVTDRHHAGAVGGEAEHERLVAAELSARHAAESAQAELAHATSHDALTGLINRAELERRVSVLLAEPPSSVVALFVDLDDFKAVNNSLGHPIGDAVLGHVAGRLTHRCRSSALVARFGGDKFVVVLAGVDLEEALIVAYRLRSALHEPYEVQGRSMSLSASMGVAVAAPGDAVDALIRKADTAVTSAKRDGRGRVAAYDDSQRQQALQRLDTETDLQATRNGEELELHYQPIFALQGGGRVGAEALMRWRHRDRGLLNPASFIDIAEDTGLIVPMGAWAIDRACRIIADWRAHGAIGTVWVNAAAPQLLRPDFAATVADAQAHHGVGAGELGIELTERTLLTEREVVAAQLAHLHRLGVQIAIDDFGTGYSSMSLLQQYPLDVLKIDRAFIARLDTPDGEAIVRAVVQLAHALGAAASAEGVETQQQLDTVRATGCDTAAGFWLSHPKPEGEPLARRAPA